MAIYDNAFNQIEKKLRTEEGVSGELDYIEQTSWIMFLKYLNDFEIERADRAALDGKDYKPLLPDEFEWTSWAAPKNEKDEIDYDKALTGDVLIEFVNNKLFPALGKLREKAAGPDTTEYKIGEIFGELRNKFRSGYVLRDIVEAIDKLSFKSQSDRHELSALYETRIRRMGNAGRNGGEYYTPRPLIRAMINVVKPKIGETIYDGAVGSAGFLCEAYDYLYGQLNGASDYDTLQKKTFYGQEKKGLAYIIGLMNMMLHGVESPNIVHTNTLNENVMDYQEKDKHDIVLANPPFGGGERVEVQQNFPIKSSETAYLFLQHFMRKLKAGGRAAVVIKNTFLSNSDNASIALRKELLETCNLHTILDCPQGTFQGAGVKTVVLFFEKGESTRQTWFYELNPGRSLGKTNPLNDADLADFIELQNTFATGEKSWIIRYADLDETNFDLSVANPNAPQAAPLRNPQEIIDDMLSREAETAEILRTIRGLL
ncbi:class I SAM-dependent DNA methyltransferase [Bartonella sp. HY761]|uniref:class I SAM-dependent DNA methyltransferase n=1 Tax=Bartonella sp. HY761 TaxID=2979330 RepID=UPI0021FC9B31|nr:N-6 DNA methylase [Bartonella sp. HY761]UXN06771.1 type I restriction-modification system subunit M [Bartonella sp. HY761]